MRWQVQEAKQRFSALLKDVASEGPQIVTKHGEDVAVVIDMAEYRHLRGEEQSFKEFLLKEPDWDDFTELDDVIAARSLPRPIDLDED